jgi:hypothetical protein
MKIMKSLLLSVAMLLVFALPAAAVTFLGNDGTTQDLGTVGGGTALLACFIVVMKRR